MRKLGLLLALAMISSCVFGCSSDKDKGKENETSTVSANEDEKKENEGTTEPLPKVTVITAVPTDLFNLFCSKEANLSESTKGYIIGYTESEMLIEEIKIVDEEYTSSGRKIEWEWVGEKTLKLADEVEVWGLFTNTSHCYIQIPLEDIDNYEAMTTRGKWSFYENVEGKICMIVQNYIWE